MRAFIFVTTAVSVVVRRERTARRGGFRRRPIRPAARMSQMSHSKLPMRRFRAVGITAIVPLVIAGLVAAVSSPQAAAAAPAAIPPPTAGGWQLNGSSVLNTTASPPNLQLTPNTIWQAGSAFWPTAVPGVGVTASFDLSIGSSNSTSGAEGLTFTVADASVTQPTALGHNGGGI